MLVNLVERRPTSLAAFLVAALCLALPRLAAAAPILPSPSQIQALVDQTASFSGNTQLSQVNSIINIPHGIEVRATFRVGVGVVDPFDPNFGQDFARISLESLLAAPLDWSAFDGLQLTVTHSTGSAFLQPFVATGALHRFHEPVGGGFNLASTLPTVIVLDFGNLRAFAPFIEPTTLADADDVRAWGIQIITNNVAVGQPVDAIIRIENRSVPEPLMLSMVGVGLVALAGRRRRHRV